MPSPARGTRVFLEEENVAIDVWEVELGGACLLQIGPADDAECAPSIACRLTEKNVSQLIAALSLVCFDASED